MRIRGIQDGDQRRIADIHAEMGLNYKMPRLDGPLLAGTVVIEHEGEVIAAGALKVEPETFLWVKQDISPIEKWDAIRLIQRDLVRQAVALGFEQMVAYVPDCVGKFFGKRLKMLRWAQARDGWRAWVYELGAK
jgi:hypothetical protein